MSNEMTAWIEKTADNLAFLLSGLTDDGIASGINAMRDQVAKQLSAVHATEVDEIIKCLETAIRARLVLMPARGWA